MTTSSLPKEELLAMGVRSSGANSGESGLSQSKTRAFLTSSAPKGINTLASSSSIHSASGSGSSSNVADSSSSSSSALSTSSSSIPPLSGVHAGEFAHEALSPNAGSGGGAQPEQSDALRVSQDKETQRLKDSFSIWKNFRTWLTGSEDEEESSLLDDSSLSMSIVSFIKEQPVSIVQTLPQLMKLQAHRAARRSVALAVMRQFLINGRISLDDDESSKDDKDEYRITSMEILPSMRHDLVKAFVQGFQGDIDLPASNLNNNNNNGNNSGNNNNNVHRPSHLVHYLDNVFSAPIQQQKRLAQEFFAILSQWAQWLKTPQTDDLLRAWCCRAFIWRYRRQDHQRLQKMQIFSILRRVFALPTQLQLLAQRIDDQYHQSLASKAAASSSAQQEPGKFGLYSKGHDGKRKTFMPSYYTLSRAKDESAPGEKEKSAAEHEHDSAFSQQNNLRTDAGLAAICKDRKNIEILCHKIQNSVAAQAELATQENAEVAWLTFRILAGICVHDDSPIHSRPTSAVSAPGSLSSAAANSAAAGGPLPAPALWAAKTRLGRCWERRSPSCRNPLCISCSLNSTRPERACSLCPSPTCRCNSATSNP